MRQRIKLAQALVHDPELLILDEPLSGMDPLHAAQDDPADQGLGAAGKSVLVSSHILHEIEAMTSNILLINNGRIVAEGNVHQIRDLIDTHPHTVLIRAARPAGAGAPAARRRRRDEPAASSRARWSSRPPARRLLRAAHRAGGHAAKSAPSTR